MSESIFDSIADELRSQENNAPVVEPIGEPIEPIEQPVVEPQEPVNQVNDQITDSVTETKQWWETEETNLTNESAKVETKVEQKESDLVLDEDLKLLMDYKKSGKTLADFVKEYQVPEYKDWSDDQIVKQGLKEFMNLTDEELEQANYEVDSATIIQKKQWAENFRQKFEEKNGDKLKELTSTNLKTDEYQKAVAQKYNADLESFSEKIVGQDLYGLKITDEMSKDLKSYIDKEFTLQREDGSFDIEKMYSVGLWLKYGKDLVKANITRARNEGKEQVISQVSNPSKNMTGGGRVVGSGLEAAQEAFNNLFPG
tara:strand:+ start:907 stop:1845 length:939 start_codon:yes stop_codon:yes gene_type:complete